METAPRYAVCSVKLCAELETLPTTPYKSSMWANWPLERSVVPDGARSTLAVSTFGAAKFTAEIVWPATVMAFAMFTSTASPIFSPLVMVTGNVPDLTMAAPAEPVTCVSDPEEQPATPEDGCVQ